MKNFLNKAKAILKTVAIHVTVWTIVGSLLFVGLGVLVYTYIKNKVRGAVSWIANKYNGLVDKFKTEVSIESTEETVSS